MTKFKTAKPSGSVSSKSTEPEVWRSVEAKLAADGIPIPHRPTDDEFVPTLPDDLTELGDEGLMELFTKFTRWLEHIGFRLARAEVIAKESGIALARVQAEVMRRNWTGSREERVTIAKAERDTDPVVIKAQKQNGTDEAYAKALGMLYDSVERKVALVSRELTRRTSIEVYQRRSHRWSGAKG